jgi:hypothetical protein
VESLDESGTSKEWFKVSNNVLQTHNKLGEGVQRRENSSRSSLRTCFPALCADANGEKCRWSFLHVYFIEFEPARGGLAETNSRQLTSALRLFGPVCLVLVGCL